MHLLTNKSICQSSFIKNDIVYVSSKKQQGYREGINKANEYSWYYQLAIQGKKNETIRIIANPNDKVGDLTRNNSLVYYSTNRFHWHKLSHPALTDHQGLFQQYEFTFPDNGTYYLSNSMLFEYYGLQKHIHALLSKQPSLWQKTIIGHSQSGLPLTMYSFTKTRHPHARILVTTGCHPAEPDIIGNLAIIQYLFSTRAKQLLENYVIDIMLMQNPDGYVNHSCLTNNGINLYWNFRYQDKMNCPEAYYLWRYMLKHPPSLYLDFHAYVHQYHRQPMPYLQSHSCYTSRLTKSVVNILDQKLIQLSDGFYRIGSLSMWPYSLSTLATKTFNTICYTKYHFNMFEGIKRSQERAVNIFSALSGKLLRQDINAGIILKPPHGNCRPDFTDSSPWRSYYNSIGRLRQAKAYVKSYSQYYRHRNRTALYS